MKKRVPDILAIVGVSAVSAGAGLVYPPAALIVAGSFLILASLARARADVARGGK